MKEIEVKLKYSSEGVLRDKLKAVNGKHKQTYEITDSYYGMAGEQVKTSQNLLRIRTKSGKSELTFKGRKKARGKDIVERAEINVPIESPDKMELILQGMGLKRIMKNRSIREYWDIGGTEVGIMKVLEPAEVEFVEIEGKTKEDVEKVTKLFAGVLEPIGKDHFKKIDDAGR